MAPTKKRGPPADHPETSSERKPRSRSRSRSRSPMPPPPTTGPVTRSRRNSIHPPYSVEEKAHKIRLRELKEKNKKCHFHEQDKHDGLALPTGRFEIVEESPDEMMYYPTQEEIATAAIKAGASKTQLPGILTEYDWSNRIYGDYCHYDLALELERGLRALVDYLHSIGIE